jgi:hypothetical protein
MLVASGSNEMLDEYEIEDWKIHPQFQHAY